MIITNKHKQVQGGDIKGYIGTKICVNFILFGKVRLHYATKNSLDSNKDFCHSKQQI